MKKVLNKITIAFLFLILITTALVIVFSPIRNFENVNQIRNEVIINAPIDEVFSYLGNSANAKKWSVFVSDIVPLNSHKIKDGEKGSVRRCFVKKEYLEQAYWDEEITKVIENKSRILKIYNFHNFPVHADGLLTEQRYYKLDANRTKLVFSLYYENQPGFEDCIKTYYSSFEIHNIFKRNMNNIKANIENKKFLAHE
jgi:uncharacterized membrane protein